MAGFHIDSFREDDIITRIESAPNDFRDYIKNPIFPKADYSYIGDCLKFIGRTGSRIYFRIYSYKQPFKKGKKFSLNYEIFKNGWAHADKNNVSRESFENLNLKNINDVDFYLNHISNMEKNYGAN